MSEEKLKIDDIQVSKGDTYTAETALNIRFNIYNDSLGVLYNNYSFSTYIIFK